MRNTKSTNKFQSGGIANLGHIYFAVPDNNESMHLHALEKGSHVEVSNGSGFDGHDVGRECRREVLFRIHLLSDTIARSVTGGKGPGT
jgi:hypothetical protein